MSTVVFKREAEESNGDYVPTIKTVDTSGYFDLIPGFQIDLLNVVAIGTDRYQRVGRYINGKRLQMRIWNSVSVSISSAVNQDVMKFAIILDNHPDGAIPSTVSSFFADLYQNGSSAGSTLSFANPTTAGRFKILAEKIVVSNPNNAAQEQIEGRTYWEWDLDLDLIQVFNASSYNDIRDISQCALYFFVWSEVGDGVLGNRYQTFYKSRYSFVD